VIFGRIVALRLPRKQATEARRRLLKEQGAKASERDLLWAEYVVLFTTVPATVLPDEAILALFRLRWQVELQIKRDKSLGGLDRLPNFRPDTIEGWVSAKLLLGALARRLVSEAFPPGAARVPGVSRAARTARGVHGQTVEPAQDRPPTALRRPPAPRPRRLPPLRPADRPTVAVEPPALAAGGTRCLPRLSTGRSHLTPMPSPPDGSQDSAASSRWQ
jgi:hypothetical protein